LSASFTIRPRGHARLVKSNEQLPANDPRDAELAEKVGRAIRAHGLFDLDTARRSLFQQSGKTAGFDLLSKSASNLPRLWAET
jgi:hypothetical protein